MSYYSIILQVIMEKNKAILSPPDRAFHEIVRKASNPATMFQAAQGLFNLAHDELDRQEGAYEAVDLFNLAQAVLNVATFSCAKPGHPVSLYTLCWKRTVPSLTEQDPGTVRQYVSIENTPPTLLNSATFWGIRQNTVAVIRAHDYETRSQEGIRIALWNEESIRQVSVRRDLHPHNPHCPYPIGYSSSWNEKHLSCVEKGLTRLGHQALGILGLNHFLYSTAFISLFKIHRIVS